MSDLHKVPFNELGVPDYYPEANRKMGDLVDPNLINPWGMLFGTGTSATPLWVSDNGMDASTLYRNNETPPPALAQLGLTGTVPGGPTGQAFNPPAPAFAVAAA